MYGLEYLPIAKQDMTDIAYYISNELAEPVVAERLASEMIESANRLIEFPYANPAYHPIRKLQHDYRRLIIKNYIMFYYIDEINKLVTIARVIYGRRDYREILE